MPSPAPSELSAGAAPVAEPRLRAAAGRTWILLGGPALVGLVHAAMVAGHYFVGSFDDDASYVLSARALLAGQGLGGHLVSGQAIVGLYPPGYGALLAPLVWIWPHSFLPLRLLSVVCFVALFPLTWAYAGRHGVGPRTRAAALTVFALGPPIATFSTMVMAETPFLVVLILLLMALDRWREAAWSPGRWAAAVIALCGALVWIKQAGIGLVAGLVLWLLLTPGPRRWRRAGAVAAGSAALLSPVLIARLAAGIPIAGDRYSQELGGFYSGGLTDRLIHVLPSSTWHLLSTAVPATLVPYLEPLPIRGHWPDLWKVLSWHVTVLVVVGAVAWARRRRDAAVPMVAVYAVESVLWPYVNERRAILVLPVLVIWYVTGAVLTARWLSARWRPARSQAARRVAAVAVLAVVAVPLVVQTPRDYLYGWKQNGSHFEGSRYALMLSDLGHPRDVVETDYRSTTALFTGHATNWTAFVASSTGVCYEPAVLADLAADRAGYVLLGDVNKPGVLDSPCLAGILADHPGAVPLLHTRRDSASVYELVGPGTGHPGLADLLASATPALLSTGPGVSTETWRFPVTGDVTQLSVGEAAAGSGPTRSVRLEVRTPAGQWVTVASAAAPVGGGPGRAPYLLARLRRPLPAVAVRVVVEGPGAAGGAVVRDAAAIGPAPAGTTTSPG